MQEKQIRDIQRDCEALSIAYARAIDFRDFDDFLALFAEDGVLDVGRVIRNREALRDSISQRPDGLRTRHIITNIFIDVVDEDHARGISYLTLYKHLSEDSNPPPGPVDSTLPAAVGHYEDHFIRTSGGWRFQSRTGHLAFLDPATF